MIRYPFAPLAALMGSSEASAARRLNVSGKTEQQYRREGLSAKVADRMAVRAGYHPYEVWPEMIAADFEDTHKAELERKARWARTRYRKDPAFRARKIASARSYYAENATYVRGRVRRYEKANREQINARRRQRYAESREEAA